MGNRLKYLKVRSDHERQEMLVLFSTTNDSILTFQKRQWMATNYCLVLLGSMFAFLKLLLELGDNFSAVDHLRFVLHVLFYIFAGLAWALTWTVLDKLEIAINTARDTNDTAVFALSPRFQRANYPEGPPSKDKRTTLRPLFRVVLSVGFFILILALILSASRI